MYVSVNAIISMIRSVRSSIKSDSLYRGSLLILFTSVLTSGFGFIFWILAAKLYTPEEVGVATAVISLITLVVLVSRFGLDQTLIRYFPTHGQSNIIGTSLVITTFFAIIFGLVVVIGADILPGDFQIFKAQNHQILLSSLFVLFIVANSLTNITGLAFIATKKAEYYFMQNLLVSTKVIFIVPFAFFGVIGILYSFGLSSIIAIVLSFVFLTRLGMNISTKMNISFLKESFHYSWGNFISGLLIMAPHYLLPIIVLSILGPEDTAYYYLVYAITSMLFLIPSAISTSLLVEGSYGTQVRTHTIRALWITLCILLPIVLLLFCFGDFLLGLLGKSYVDNGIDLLHIMVISSIFVAVNYVYISIRRIQGDIKSLISISSLIFVSQIISACIFLRYFGIIGIGYAWILSYCIGSILIFVNAKKEGWIFLQ